MIPLYLAVVLASWLLVGRVGGLWVFPLTSTDALFEHALLIDGVRTLWTIPVEVHYYVVFVFAWTMHERGRTVLGLAAILASFVGTAALLGAFVGETDHLPYWGHYLVVGTVAGLLWKRHRAAFDRWAAGRTWTAWLVLAVFVATLPGLRTAAGLPVAAAYKDPAGLAVPILIFAMALGQIGPFRALATPALRFLGRISYGFYLFHFPVLLSAKGVLHPDRALEGLAVFALACVVTGALAWLSFVGFETPARRLLSHLGDRLGAATAPAVAARGAGRLRPVDATAPGRSA